VNIFVDYTLTVIVYCLHWL